MEEVEKIIERYELSEEESDLIFEKIKNLALKDKTPVEHPKAIVDLAPPGSGKTGLNGYSLNQFENKNAIIINGDELKGFHPKAKEIAQLYPELYAKITDRNSNKWADKLVELALKQKYNVIYEGTGNSKVMLNIIKNKMDNHEITIRTLAVNDLNCLMSILDRYEGQVDRKEYGRLVTEDRFYHIYNSFLDVIDKLEKSGIAKSIEVYTRGEKIKDKVRIYASDDKEKTYPDAKTALIDGRKKDFSKAMDYFEKTFSETMKNILKKDNISEGEINIINKIKEIVASKSKKEEYTK